MSEKFAPKKMVLKWWNSLPTNMKDVFIKLTYGDDINTIDLKMKKEMYNRYDLVTESDLIGKNLI